MTENAGMVIFVFLVPLGLLALFLMAWGIMLAGLFRVLRNRAPEVYDSLGRFKRMAASRSVLKGDRIRLDEPSLSGRCRWMRRFFYIYSAFFLAYLVWIVAGGFILAELDRRSFNRLPKEAFQGLRVPREATLYSLNPLVRNATGEGSLHGFAILGWVELAPDQAAKAAAEFKSAIFWSASISSCFTPRHALRVNHRGTVYDYLLCYECGGISVYKDGDFLASSSAAGSPDALNAIFKARGISIAPAVYGEGSKK